MRSPSAPTPVPTRRRPVARSLAGATLAGAALSLAALSLAAGPALAATVHQVPSTTVLNTWGTDGRVDATAMIGSTLYIAGDFDNVVDTSGTKHAVRNLAAFNTTTGAFKTTWHPNPNGTVDALAASSGTLYLGGDFTSVGGTARSRLAAVTASSGSLTSWKPGANNTVQALTVAGGNVLVGGFFGKITDSAGTHNVANLVSIGASSGKLNTAFSPAPNGRVRALRLASNGTTVYVGGEFGRIAGKAVKSLALIQTGSGALVSSFAPGNYGQSNNKPPVFDLDLSGSTLLVASGGGGGTCAALYAGGGGVDWSIHTNGNVQAVTASGSTAYCGGHFSGNTSFGGQPRYKLGAVTISSGAIQSYAPRINSALGVWTLYGTSTKTYLGGDFTKVGSANQPHFAVLEN